MNRGRLVPFFISRTMLMEKTHLVQVLEKAAPERGCTIDSLSFDEDDNIIEVTIDKVDGNVSLMDCEYVHRAVLAAFDRNIEDYSLTVSSKGIDGKEADEMLKTMENNQ